MATIKDETMHSYGVYQSCFDNGVNQPKKSAILPRHDIGNGTANDLYYFDDTKKNSGQTNCAIAQIQSPASYIKHLDTSYSLLSTSFDFFNLMPNTSNLPSNLLSTNNLSYGSFITDTINDVLPSISTILPSAVIPSLTIYPGHYTSTIQCHEKILLSDNRMEQQFDGAINVPWNHAECQASSSVNILHLESSYDKIETVLNTEEITPDNSDNKSTSNNHLSSSRDEDNISPTETYRIRQQRQSNNIRERKRIRDINKYMDKLSKICAIYRQTEEQPKSKQAIINMTIDVIQSLVKRVHTYQQQGLGLILKEKKSDDSVCLRYLPLLFQDIGGKITKLPDGSKSSDLQIPSHPVVKKYNDNMIDESLNNSNCNQSNSM